MGPVSVVRRAGLTLALLLVAVLGAVGVSAPLAAHDPLAVVGDADAGVAIGGSRVDAMAPSRAVGRLLAEPSLVSVQGPDDGMPFDTAPGGLSPVDLIRVGVQCAIVTARPGAAHHGMWGVRAPPARRSDL